MLRFALAQLESDLSSGGYKLEHSSYYGFEAAGPVDYLVFHSSVYLPLGRLTQRNSRASMEYDPFSYADIDASYHSGQAQEIISARLRLFHAE